MVNSTQPGCVLTSTMHIDTTIFEQVFQNETCNGPSNCTFHNTVASPGTIAFASGAVSGVQEQDDFRVAQMAFCAAAPGNAVIHWQFAPPDPASRDSQIFDGEGNIVNNRALYTDFSIHVVPAVPVLVGHVTLQGRPTQPSIRQSVPITLRLRQTSGGPIYSFNTTTDASGNFTVTAPGPGLYNYWVKNAQTLANTGSASLAVGANNVEMGLLLEGDTNNDNCISIQDFSILKGSFGKSLGDPGYDVRADFNGDGPVNVRDFNLQKGNFGLCGAAPITMGR